VEELKNCKDTVSLIRAYALYRPLLRKEDILSLRCFSDTTISLPIARVILGDYFYFAIKILQLFGWEESRLMGWWILGGRLGWVAYMDGQVLRWWWKHGGKYWSNEWCAEGEKEKVMQRAVGGKSGWRKKVEESFWGAMWRSIHA